MSNFENVTFEFAASETDTTSLRVEKTRRQELSRDRVREGKASQEDLFLVPRSIARGIRFQYKA